MPPITKNSDRFTACDRWHKNIPSEFRIYSTLHWVNGKPTVRKHCLTCDKYRRAVPRKARVTPKGMAFSPYGARLGVYPLTWKPPCL